jgi:hypothetical protein
VPREVALSMKHVWLAVVLLGVALAGRHAWTGAFSHDDLEHAHAAWRISVGDRPFVDFQEQHHPTVWLLLAPLVRAFARPADFMFVARAINLLMMALAFVLLARVARRLHPGAQARWPLVALGASTMFVESMMEVRPDPAMMLAIVAALDAWTAFLVEDRLSRALAAGLALGVAAAFLQKALVVAALVGGAALVVAVLRPASARARLVGGMVLAGIAAAVPLGALFAYVAARGWWRDFWLWNYPFNAFFYLEARLPLQLPPWKNLLYSALEDLPLWGFGLAGVALALRRRLRRAPRDGREDARLTVALVTAVYLVLLLRNRFVLKQYFLVPLPLLALSTLELLHGWRARWPYVTIALATLVQIANLTVFEATNEDQRALEAALLARVRPDETVFAPPPHHPIFRRSVGYFWYNAAMMSDAYAQYCASRRCEIDARRRDDDGWSAAPPAMVYVDPDEPAYRPPRWESRRADYRPSEIPNLWVRRAP